MQASVETFYTAKCPCCGRPLVQYLHVDADGFKVICMFCYARFRCDLQPDGFEFPDERPSD